MKPLALEPSWCDRVSVRTAQGSEIDGFIGLVGAAAFELWTTGGERRLMASANLALARCVEHDAPYAFCSPGRLHRA